MCVSSSVEAFFSAFVIISEAIFQLNGSVYFSDHAWEKHSNTKKKTSDQLKKRVRFTALSH